MKFPKLLYLGAPVTAYLIYSFNGHNNNNNTYNILQAAEHEMKLEQVQVIFRHGARTPTTWTKERFQHFTNIEQEFWDKDKWLKKLPGTDLDYVVKLGEDGSDPSGETVDDTFGAEMNGGCLNGQLTYVGQEQLFNVGKWLAEKYIKQGFISSKYQRDEIYVRSSYYRRTIQSAICLLAGLYGEDNFNERVYIETKEPEKEDICGNLVSCRSFRKWFFDTTAQQALSLDEQELETYLNMLMGRKENIRNAKFNQINDLIRCRKTHGLNVPQYLLDHRELINKSEIKLMEYIFGKGRLDMIRHAIGSFIETISCRIEEYLEGSNQTKMLLYSAHDWTILNLLIAFHIDIKEFPHFGSHLILEIYRRDDDKRFIRILLNGEPIMFDNADEEFLPVETFLKSLQRYRVLDWDAECDNIPQQQPQQPPPPPPPPPPPQ